MIKAGIIGGAGYTGGEMIRLLLRHPACELKFVQSRSQQGSKLSAIHDDLIGETDLCFSSNNSNDVDVLFLCMGHGESKKFLDQHSIPGSVRIIDLSQDFRLNDSTDRKFVYGLPEINREKIRLAQNIANPGCFATALQLAILPLAAAEIFNADVHIHALTGSTGAGQSPGPTSHFSWRDSNVSLYKPFKHQHLAEISQTIKILQPGWTSQMNFLPMRGNFTRGIFASLYLQSDLQSTELEELYESFYTLHPFVFVSEKNPSLKQVVNTNKCVLFPEKHGDQLLIISMIDNLLKGAAGQAVQNMNLMFGLDESSGLNLKASAF